MKPFSAIHIFFKQRKIPLRISLIYLIIGIAWILFSDLLLTSIISDPKTFTGIGIIKGWFFILLTAILLFILINHATSQLEQSQQALQASESKFRLLTETVSAMVIIYQDEELKYANTFTETLTGYSKDELQKLKFWQLFHLDDRKMVRERGLARQRGDAVLSRYEAKLVSRSGQEHWVELSAGVIEYLNRPAGIATAYDITERKQAENALRENQRFLSTLISNLPGMAYRCRNDKDWTMEFVSEGCQQLTGYSSSDLILSKNIAFAQLIHPEYRDSIWNEVQAALKEKRSYQLMYPITSANGEVRWLWEQGRGVFSTGGEFLALEGYISDITEERQAHEALQLQVRELTCLNEIRHVATTTDTSIDAILEKVKKILPTGFRESEITDVKITFDGRSYSSPGFEETQPRISARLAFKDATRGAIEVSRSRVDSGQKTMPFSEQEQNFLDGITYAIALIIERLEGLHEREIMLEQLRHADRLATIGQLSAGVAHELNEPLAGILGFAQLATKTPELPNQVKKDMEKIIAAALHSREIIQKLMLFGRQMPAGKAHIDLNKMITEGLFFLESRCAKQGVELVKDFDPNLPEIFADSTQLNQVLVNLVVNAVQAMPDGGKLTIKTFKEYSTVKLIVADTGIGMSQEVKARIFDPFFTTKEVGEGTGLGLSVVHGIVASHKGSIEVESEVGRGARFTILMPCAGLE